LADAERESAVEKLANQHLVSEIHPYVSDAWIDHSKTKIGYEIPFTRQFYTYLPPRQVDEIQNEVTNIEIQIQKLLGNLHE
jgi:type I restriction enzyme M protein